MYPNPYMAASSIPKMGLFGKLGAIKSINWGGLLEGTQKTLGVINQAIPIVYQIKPIVSNAKTMLRIANTIQEPDEKKETSQPEQAPLATTAKSYSNEPMFYI